MPETNPTPARPRRSWRWRVGTPLALASCGALFVVSALNSDGTDLRPGRYTDLYQFVGSEAQRYQGLEDQVRGLTAQVNDLTAQVSDTGVRKLRQQAAQLREEAGTTGISGPGVTITMQDADDTLIRSASDDVATSMVVHQQDVQAVVNALWRGGATAMTINGQRIITTTGIKCTGSTISLQGVPYPQPFVIEAVGDPLVLMHSVNDDDYVTLYREAAADPSIAIGWDMQNATAVTAPPYTGLRDLSYARPLK